LLPRRARAPSACSILASSKQSGEFIQTVDILTWKTLFLGMQSAKRSREGETYLIRLRRFTMTELVVVVLYFVLLFVLCHLQYYDFRARTIVYPILWLSAAFVIYKLLFEKSRERRGILQLGGIIGFFVLLYYGVRLTGFCSYVNYGTSYVNQKDSSVTITSRGYGCFMTDVDFDYTLERRLTAHLKWITDLDVQHLDPASWRRLSK
jgi:hypothetical protein